MQNAKHDAAAGKTENKDARVATLLTQALKAALRGGRVDWNGSCAAPGWDALYHLAREHRVQALVLEAVYACPDYAMAEATLKHTWRRDAMAVSAGQALRWAAFEEVYGAMLAAGLRPVVMKGAVCRRLYADPGLRPSSDEDLLLPPEQFAAGYSLLLDLGLRPIKAGADPAQDHEIGMVSSQGLLIELHRSPFPSEGAAVEHYNAFFAHVHAEAVMEEGLLVMPPQEHMLYLLLHAGKHFIHSGFGLRQVCDIALWAQRYGRQIHWPRLWAQCGRVRCLKFSRTVFALAEMYLGFDREEACMESLPEGLPVGKLLEDLLGAGVFGSSTGSRVHSATVTLNAVEADRRGTRTSVLHSLFPKGGDLQGRYPYLKKYPVLLPVAWCSRLGHYALEVIRPRQVNSPAESLALGERRKTLLRDLDMID